MPEGTAKFPVALMRTTNITAKNVMILTPTIFHPIATEQQAEGIEDSTTKEPPLREIPTSAEFPDAHNNIRSIFANTAKIKTPIIVLINATKNLPAKLKDVEIITKLIFAKYAEIKIRIIIQETAQKE
jgi:hypothetical protein